MTFSNMASNVQIAKDSVSEKTTTKQVNHSSVFKIIGITYLQTTFACGNFKPVMKFSMTLIVLA